jgi:hypothetical protein
VIVGQLLAIKTFWRKTLSSEDIRVQKKFPDESHVFQGTLLCTIICPTSDPLIRGTDQDPEIRILLSSSKNSKINLDFYCFVTSL